MKEMIFHGKKPSKGGATGQRDLRPLTPGTLGDLDPLKVHENPPRVIFEFRPMCGQGKRIFFFFCENRPISAQNTGICAVGYGVSRERADNSRTVCDVSSGTQRGHEFTCQNNMAASSDSSSADLSDQWSDYADDLADLSVDIDRTEP